MLTPTYSDLKEQTAFNVSVSGKHGEKLCSLKELFKEVINSPRRFERISTVGELIKILEIRDVLSDINVEPLKEIAQRVNNSSELLKMIADYECNHTQGNNHNEYGVENVTPLQNRIHIQKTMPAVNTNSNLFISERKKLRIYEAIIEQIGTFWCALGRKLKIRECVIDEINRSSDNLYDKAAKILEIYEQKADPQNWFLVLCHALDKAQREDLTKTIQEIMMMNI